MSRQGKRRAVEETSERTSDVSNIRPIQRPPTPSVESLVMRPENHPWLQWPGCSANRKIELNNNLAHLQGKSISSPKFMDWNLCTSLGVDAELDTLFLTRYVDAMEFNPVPFDVRVWKKAFDVREDAYREWCLEFYSSLELDEVPQQDHLVYGTPIIGFRLGGKDHKVTISQFGQLAGLFTREEAENRDNMSGYVLKGSWTSTSVRERRNEVWLALSGKPKHSSTSKATDIKSPILRLIHKMITYSFLQRSTHQDKVYVEDLWLLSWFAKRNPERFVNAPWALVSYMMEKGGGRQSNGPMVCGHFVTRIGKNLGLATPANFRNLSPGVGWKLITKQDLRKAELLTQSGMFVAEEVGTSSQAPPPAPRQAQRSMRDEIFRIGREIDGTRRDVHGIGDFVQYFADRYQPALEPMARQHYMNTPGSSSEWLPYNPPPMYPSNPSEEEYQQGEEYEEGD